MTWGSEAKLANLQENLVNKKTVSGMITSEVAGFFPPTSLLHLKVTLGDLADLFLKRAAVQLPKLLSPPHPLGSPWSSDY